MWDEGELVRSDMTVYHKGWADVTRNGRLPNSKLGAIKQEEIWWRSNMTD